MIYAILFISGAAIGSYLDVLGTRYTPKDGFKKSLVGRSRCDYCGNVLRPHELIPIASFALQAGRCRKCKKKFSLRYPFVETVSGAIAVFVPLTLGITLPALVWALAFFAFIVLAIIDIRLSLIPDSVTAFIAALGAALVVYFAVTGSFGLRGGDVNGTFLRHYALPFWIFGQNVYANFALGVLVGGAVFAVLYLLSRGRAMGFGDVKLGAAVGLLMGWPDVALALTLSFIIGGIIGALLIFARKKNMKSTIPFGPFIVVGVALTFFFGYDIVNGYFALFSVF